MNAEYDVAVVGYGPIGEMAAIMLGRRGWKVAVFERWPELYPLPRAVVYDDEIARLFEQEGLLADVSQITDPVPDFYEWRNRDGEALLKIDWSQVGPTGRPVANFFSQPELQNLLDRHVGRQPSIDVYRGWQVEALAEGEHAVDVTARHGHPMDGGWVGDDEQMTIGARFVIGADGANSTVRAQMGGDWHDLGFQFDWLIVDLVPHEHKQWSPMNWQLCDPARPTTIVSGGPGRRRWEFMRLPGEEIAQLNTEATAWRLLEPWGRTPENTTLERHAVYTFEAKWAQRWRRGRLLLAGDAAHLMPPFAGQGMCGGMRDLANLIWKLDLTLRGRVAAGILDTYGPERAQNVQHFIHLSMSLGQIICVLDEEAASERDRRMIAGGADPAKVLPQGPPPRLGPGLLSDHAAAGLPMPQGRVRRGSRTGLTDQVIPSGFLLLVSQRAALPELTAEQEAALDALAVTIIALDDEAFEDIDGVYGRWLTDQDAVSVLLRPDCYVYGAAATAAETQTLVAELVSSLDPGTPTAGGDARPLDRSIPPV